MTTELRLFQAENENGWQKFDAGQTKRNRGNKFLFLKCFCFKERFEFDKQQTKYEPKFFISEIPVIMFILEHQCVSQFNSTTRTIHCDLTDNLLHANIRWEVSVSFRYLLSVLFFFSSVHLSEPTLLLIGGFWTLPCWCLFFCVLLSVCLFESEQICYKFSTSLLCACVCVGVWHAACGGKHQRIHHVQP